MTDRPKQVRACAAADLKDGDVRRIDPPNQPPIAVYRLGDAFYATDDTCTHGAASLSDGFVENGEVECPYHLGRFDVRTGEPTLHPCTVALRTYPVMVEGNTVYVDTSGADPSGTYGRNNT
jgi:nitrite reductase/ring-hydroxylating ferredoxin subunit